MMNGRDRRRAMFLWEATCERLRNALKPPDGAPVSTILEQAEALGLARTALDALETAFELNRSANRDAAPAHDDHAGELDGSDVGRRKEPGSASASLSGKGE